MTFEQYQQVSIHAPARGATEICNCRRKRATGFNSRTREGCDKFRIFVNASKRCFNSRTREGCDAVVPSEMSSQTVSIHAPARGATQKYVVARFFR